MLLKKPAIESDLETQLTAVSNELRKTYKNLQDSRNALGAEIRALRDAPPSRADLERFLTGFLDLVITTEHPHGLTFKLREKLERFVKDPGGAEEIKAGWWESIRSGLDEFDWFFVPLMAPIMIENAGTVAKTIPWPQTDVSDESDRRQRIAALEEKSAALTVEIDAILDRAARLNIKLD